MEILHPFRIYHDDFLGVDKLSAYNLKDRMQKYIVNWGKTKNEMFKSEKGRMIIKVPNEVHNLSREELTYDKCKKILDQINKSDWYRKYDSLMYELLDTLDISLDCSDDPYYTIDFSRGYLIYTFFAPEERYAIDVRNDSGLWEMVALSNSEGRAIEIAESMNILYDRCTFFRARMRDCILKTFDAPRMNEKMPRPWV